MNILHSLLYLLSFSFFTWLLLLLFFNSKTMARVLFSGFLGACIFQLVNYLRIGFVDPFIFFAAVLSFIFSLCFSVFFEFVFSCLSNQRGR